MRKGTGPRTAATGSSLETATTPRGACLAGGRLAPRTVSWRIPTCRAGVFVHARRRSSIPGGQGHSAGAPTLDFAWSGPLVPDVAESGLARHGSRLPANLTTRAMSYLRELAAGLEPILAAHRVPADGRDEITAYVTKAALASYRNGLAEGRSGKRPPTKKRA